MPATIEFAGDDNAIFVLKSQLFQNPVFASPKGCRVQGIFSLRAKKGTQGGDVQVVVLESETILVADVSGSMRGARIRALFATILRILEAIPDGQVLGIIIFSSSDQARWLVKPVVLSTKSRAEITKAANGLTAGGGTCFSVPLQMAIKELLGSSKAVLQLDFMSDGESNDGSITHRGVQYSDMPGALALAQDDIAGRIIFNVYGMGTEYNTEYMTKLATAGEGTLYHIFGDGSSLNQVIALNAARASRAIARNVVVTIETQNGFEFFRDPKTNKYEVYRTAPEKGLVDLDNPTRFVDAIDLVNDVEGIPYEFTLSGPALTPPEGTTGNEWDVLVAKMTISYQLPEGTRTETIDLVQTFTYDVDVIVVDESVADTMRQTAAQVTANQLITDYSMAVSMDNTIAAAAISQQMTMVAESVRRAGQIELANTLDELAGGMGSRNLDELKGKQTMMLSGSFDDFMSGMGSQ